MENQWHQHILRVHYQDTDQMGVAHHANYVGWLEIGRTEMIRSAGLSYREMENLGLLLPVVGIDIQYRRPAHYDDSIAIYTKMTRFSGVRLEFEYEIRRIDEALLSHEQSEIIPNGKLLSKATTKHMWVDRDWKPARIDKIAPEVFALLLENFSTAEKND